MLLGDIQPSFFPTATRIIVIGDVHGDVQTFMRCMYAAKVFNHNLEWIAEPKDTFVVQLGDQIDSASRGGSETWENTFDIDMLYLTDRLDHIARMHGGRVISILGNHELMNVTGEFTYVSPKSMSKTGVDDRRKMFQPGGQIAQLLAKRNVVVRIGPYLFCHGGLLPHHLIAVDNNLHRINDVLRKFLRNQSLTPEESGILHQCIVSDQGILWTRMYVHLQEANPTILESAITDVLNTTDCTRIFVGHNTVQHVALLANGKLVLTDVGLSRAYGENKIQFIEIHNDAMRVIEITNNKI